MFYACEWVKKVLTSGTATQNFPCKWVEDNWNEETKQTPYPCEALEDYFLTQALAVTPAAATKASYWGTAVSAMQSDIVVADGKITGTLKYLDEGQLVTDWGAGNFMALKFTVPENATSCKVGLDPSEGSGLVELDEDKDGVFKVADNETQKFVIVTTDGVHTLKQEFDLSELVCQDE
jgi:hypothetical protein